MDKKVIVRLHSSFEAMVQTRPDTGTEFWCARDLQMLLGYARWEKRVERRLKSEQKKLPKQVDRLEGGGDDRTP